MEEGQLHIITIKYLMVNGKIICLLENAVYLLAIYGAIKDTFITGCFMDKEIYLLMGLVLGETSGILIY
jgi:hypothetical protein